MLKLYNKINQNGYPPRKCYGLYTDVSLGWLLTDLMRPCRVVVARGLGGSRQAVVPGRGVLAQTPGREVSEAARCLGPAVVHPGPRGLVAGGVGRGQLAGGRMFRVHRRVDRHWDVVVVVGDLQPATKVYKGAVYFNYFPFIIK